MEEIQAFPALKSSPCTMGGENLVLLHDRVRIVCSSVLGSVLMAPGVAPSGHPWPQVMRALNLLARKKKGRWL